MSRPVFSVFYVFSWETLVPLLFCVLSNWNGFWFLYNRRARQFILSRWTVDYEGLWLSHGACVLVTICFLSPVFHSQLTTREPWCHPGYLMSWGFDDAPTLYFLWLKGLFWGLFCSWPVGWELVCRDVSPGASVWMSLCGAGLLEGQDRWGRACHHPWIHHDNRNILQGRVKGLATRQLGDLAPWK